MENWNVTNYTQHLPNSFRFTVTPVKPERRRKSSRKHSKKDLQTDEQLAAIDEENDYG